MRYIRNGFIALLIFLILVFITNITIIKNTKYYIFDDIKGISKKNVALVLGARVYKNGNMSSILADRVKTAMELYRSGKASKILLSGDHGTKEYDEVNAMKKYLILNGIKEKDIFTDHAGFDTYDSMYRARDVFQVESMVIATQSFHLPRAVYIARELGIDAIGIKANKQKYLYSTRNSVRETFARVKAYLDIKLKSKPKFLGEVIDIEGDGRESWD